MKNLIVLLLLLLALLFSLASGLGSPISPVSLEPVPPVERFDQRVLKQSWESLGVGNWSGQCLPVASLQDEITYTAVVIPLWGKVDLFVFLKTLHGWRLVTSSQNAGQRMEMLQLSRNDIRPRRDEFFICWAVFGRSDALFLFGLYNSRLD